MFLCDDLLKLIFQYVDLRCLYETIRLVDRQWARVSNDDIFWQSVSLKGKHNDTDHFLHIYEAKIKYLQIVATTWTRKNSYTLQRLSSLKFLDLGRVFSDSIIDDTFCELVSDCKIQSLILPKSSITDKGFLHLSIMPCLQKLEMRMNNFVTEAMLVYCMHANFNYLKHITFCNVSAVRQESLLAIGEKKLKTVHVSFCRFVDEECIFAFSNIPNLNLRSCIIYGIAISERTIYNFSKNCPNIGTFALNSVRSHVVQDIVWLRFEKLNTLILVCCEELSTLNFLKQSLITNLFLCRTNLVIDSNEKFKEMYRLLCEKGCTLKHITDAVI